MVFSALAVWIMLGLLSSGSPAQSVISVRHWEPVEYPAKMKLARVQGAVSITATLKEKENSSDYQIETYEAKGHTTLREAAVENLKKWSFYCYECKSREDKTYHVVDEFRFDEKCIESGCFKRSTTFRSGRVLVETSPPEVVAIESKQ